MSPLNVDEVMQQIEGEARARRRARLLAAGAPPEYADAELFEAVEAVLRRVVRERGAGGLLLPQLFPDEEDWELQTHLRLSSHRGAVGRLIVLVKRRVLLPLTRWLYEYTQDNFRRQQRLNAILFRCIEELAIENATLRRAMAERADAPGGAPSRSGGGDPAAR